MAFTLKQLRYFVAAAELGSITKATKTLYISQPSISAAIGHLEEEFGIELFVRHQAKGLSLTSTGKRFVGAANRLLLQADSLNQYVTSLVTEIGGTVDVGCMVTLAPLVMPSAIASFKRRYPAATLPGADSTRRRLYPAPTQPGARRTRRATYPAPRLRSRRCATPRRAS